jgi:glycerol-3-phosphate dehydrogenase
LLGLYGGRAGEVVATADQAPELLCRLHPDAPDIAAQVVYGLREEWATSASDVLLRRTTLALRGLATPEVVADVERIVEGCRDSRALPAEASERIGASADRRSGTSRWPNQ